MKTRRLARRPIAWMAVLLAAAGMRVLAQDLPQADFAHYRIPGWSFTPGVSIGGVWDSNIALAAPRADTASTRGDRLLMVEPFGRMDYLSRRTEFSGGYRGFLRRYMDVSQLNGFDQRGDFSVRRLATKRLTLSSGDTFTKVPTTDEIDLNGVPFSRTGARMNAFTAGADARLTKYTDLSVGYENTWVSFDRRDRFFTGGSVNGVHAGLTRHFTDRVAAGVEASVRRADLNNGRRITFEDAGGTLRFGAAEHTSLSIATGLSHLVDRAVDNSRSGPYLRVALTHRAEQAAAGLSFERMYVPSFGFGGSNQSEELRGFVRSPLGRSRAYVDASAGWRHSNPLVANDLPLDTIRLHTALGYALSRWLRPEIFYGFTRQDSRVTGGEVNRHRAGVEFVISQPMRIR